MIDNLAMVMNLPSGRHVEIFVADDTPLPDARNYRIDCDGEVIGRVWLDDVCIWRNSTAGATVGYSSLIEAALVMLLPAFEADSRKRVVMR